MFGGKGVQSGDDRRTAAKCKSDEGDDGADVRTCVRLNVSLTAGIAL